MPGTFCLVYCCRRLLGGIIPNLFFPYITGKNFAFRILVEILLALYVLLAIREPKYRPRSSSLCWAFGAMVVWMALATIFSVDPSKSFWSNFERMDGYITLIHLFALFVIAGAMLTAEKWWEKFFQVSIAASMLQGVYAVMQIFHIFGFAPSSQSGARADTTFGNATYLAVFMLFNLFIALFLLIRERKNRGAWIFYGIAIVLQVIGLYYTETRGTLLGALGGLIIAALYIVWKARDARVEALAHVLAVGSWSMVVLVVGLLPQKIRRLYNTRIRSRALHPSRLSTEPPHRALPSGVRHGRVLSKALKQWCLAGGKKTLILSSTNIMCPPCTTRSSGLIGHTISLSTGPSTAACPRSSYIYRSLCLPRGRW